MHINFVLPEISMTAVVGGYRVHYEYVNRLARRGHAVTLSHLVRVNGPVRGSSIRKTMAEGVGDRISWFDFDPRVEVTILPNGRFLKPADVLVLTSWQTAEFYGQRTDAAWVRAQVAYDYEFWATADASTRAAMARAFRKPELVVSTSRVVESMLRECGVRPAARIACGFDQETFRLRADDAPRDGTVGILLRDHESKRVDDAIAALAQLRNQRPGLRVLAGGQWSKSTPAWIERVDTTSDAALARFYNAVGIFVLASRHEGWGLPAMEALACGCAVISSRNGGVEDFLEDGVNALLFTPMNVEELAERIARLLDDAPLRAALAGRGPRTAASFTWDRAVEQLERLLLERLERT